MASTAPTRKRRDGDSSSTSPSSSSTSDSTSTTVFDVTKAVFTTTTTTSEEDDSSRQVVQASSSEIAVNVQQQGPAASGITSQTIQGPTGFNVILPMGRSVPVVFTDQGICIAGYNAPMAVTETEDEVTTTTTTTEQQQQQQEQDIPVAGIFQLLPAGSYLPTFVNIDQVDDEDEGCDEEKPAEEYDEDGPGGEEEAEPPAVRIVETSVHQQETFVHLGPLQADITAVKVEQKYEHVDGHREAFVQCNYQPLDGATMLMTPPRPSRDADVQFGHDPVEDLAKDNQPPLQPMRDFGAQCVYEPERAVTRTAYRVQSRTMHDFGQQHDYGVGGWHARDVYVSQEMPGQDAEQQHGYEQKNWGVKMAYGAESVPMKDFGMQHDITVAMSPPPTAAKVLYGMVDMAVGDSRPLDVEGGQRRFPQRPMSRVRSGPSLSSCASSVFMFGNLEDPHMASAGIQAGEIGRQRPSPTFAVSAQRSETASYPCVAVCSRNTVNHPCMLNISSYPGRLSQAAQTRDAIFQTEEPVAVRAPPRSQDFVDHDLADARSRSQSREPSTRTPLREVAVQTYAGAPAPRTASPPSSPSYCPGPFGMSPMSSSRCTSPGRDATLQTDRFADICRSPPGGPFRHDQFAGQVAEATRSLGHDIMIQASTVAPAASHGWAPVVVEHKVGIGGKLAQLLMLRKQQGLTPEQPNVEDKGTSEGPYVGPNGEQDYGDRSGEGDFSETGAVLGSAELAADGSAVPGAARRSSIETTSNVTRSTKVTAILPEVTVACFLLALLLVLVASAALLSWTTRRHARLSLAGESTKKAFHPSNITYIIPPFRVLPHDRHLQTIDPSLQGKTITFGPGNWTSTSSHGSDGSTTPSGPTATTPSSASYELCMTEFCVKEGQMLRYLLKSHTDPCKDFYKYVCNQWPSQQPPGASYTGADGALAADIEARNARIPGWPGNVKHPTLIHLLD
ncbi:hypothetical protein MTO96_028530 [Rhipicephalus appendiculatus]